MLATQLKEEGSAEEFLELQRSRPKLEKVQLLDRDCMLSRLALDVHSSWLAAVLV